MNKSQIVNIPTQQRNAQIADVSSATTAAVGQTLTRAGSMKEILCSVPTVDSTITEIKMKFETEEEYLNACDKAKFLYHCTGCNQSQISKNLGVSINTVWSMITDDEKHEKRLLRIRKKEQKMKMENEPGVRGSLAGIALKKALINFETVEKEIKERMERAQTYMDANSDNLVMFNYWEGHYHAFTELLSVIQSKRG